MGNCRSSAEAVADRYGLGVIADFYAHERYFTDDPDCRDVYKVTLYRRVPGWVRQYTFTFGQSVYKSTGHGGNPPDIYDVLSCITKQDPGSYEDFCSDFGYIEGSIQAEKAYPAVQKEYRGLCQLFPEGIPQDIQDIS